jgi:hypothetical protein
MKMMTIIMALLAVALVAAPTAEGLPFGTEATIYDGVHVNKYYFGPTEDEEVEPWNARGQWWDLEAFFFDGTKLTVISGYDLRNPIHPDASPGDLFLDVTGDVKYGWLADGTGYGNGPIPNTFGYDYVLDFDAAVASYSLIAIDASATLLSSRYAHDQTSNPWRYLSGGTVLATGLPLAYYSGLTDAETGFLGGSHYAATVDLGFLPEYTTFTAHLSMMCGNDNLMGRGTRVPDSGPAVLLLGVAVLLLSPLKRLVG